MKFETAAIHSEKNFSTETGSVIPPIFATSTFSYGNKENFDYTRSGNPNFRNLESTLSALENAKYTTVFSSGVSAITALCSTLKQGDTILAEENLYGCTIRLFRDVLSHFGIEIEYIDFSNPQNYSRIASLKPAFVLLESPTNPLLKLIDIQEVSRHAKKAGCITVVDNTFSSSFLQKPLDLGADISLVSTTKYSNGHSDALGGAVSTNDSTWHKKMVFAQKSLGLAPSPFDCFLISRGLKTLALRMERHSSNSLRIAEFLESHPKIEWVKHPFLESFPQKDLAKKQMKGGSGIVVAKLSGNISSEKAKEFLQSLQYFCLAESLGGVESLACHPFTMTHGSVSTEQKYSVGLTESVIRLSVGIEHIDDLLQDLSLGLQSL